MVVCLLDGDERERERVVLHCAVQRERERERIEAERGFFLHFGAGVQLLISSKASFTQVNHSNTGDTGTSFMYSTEIRALSDPIEGSNGTTT